MTQSDLIELTFEQLGTALEQVGAHPKAVPMRARQLWNWVHVHGARDFEKMSNLSRDYRRELASRFAIGRPTITTEQQSTDGTRKWLLQGSDGAAFETVFIPEPGRGTLCVSSQVGCTLNCRFCHTGTQRLV